MQARPALRRSGWRLVAVLLCAVMQQLARADAAVCSLCDARAQVPCKGCGIDVYCSTACRREAFSTGVVHPVLARLDSQPDGVAGSGDARQGKAPESVTLLCGGDAGNAIRGVARGDPSLCTGLASIKLGWTQERINNEAAKAKKMDADDDDALLAELSQWPSVAREIEPALPAANSLMQPEIAAQTRVEDTSYMGRVLLAAKDIAVGEVTLQEAPLLIWPTGVSSQVRPGPAPEMISAVFPRLGSLSCRCFPPRSSSPRFNMHCRGTTA
jgi:hypothetical protein